MISTLVFSQGVLPALKIVTVLQGAASSRGLDETTKSPPAALIELDVQSILQPYHAAGRLSFTKRFFRCQAIHWWNALPSAFFHDITTFSSNLFRHLLDFT